MHLHHGGGTFNDLGNDQFKVRAATRSLSVTENGNRSQKHLQLR